jgi:hypothetical protein
MKTEATQIQDLAMTPPSTGRTRPLAALFLVLLAVLPAAHARADDLNRALGKFSEQIKQLLDVEGESAIALNQFTAPARLASNASSGIRKALEGELKKREILVKNSARLEVNGDYREAEDPIRKKTVVRIHGRVVDQNSGRLLSEYNMNVDNLTSIAGLVGATMVVPLEPVREERERAIRDGIQKPSTYVVSTRISAGPKSPFAVEVLVGPSRNGELRPRPATVVEGQAYMNIQTSERYAIRLINDAPFEVAATLTIDGLSLFAFSDNPEYRYVIVPERSSGLITGWHRTNSEAEEFVVTEYPRSAATSRSLTPSTELGMITVCFAAAWPASGNPPPDEGMEGRSIKATGRGPITKANFVEVERKTGKLRAAISVRYTKEDEPEGISNP